MDSQAPVRPPLDRFQRAFDIDFRVLFAAINPAILLGLRPVLTHSPPLFRHGKFSAHETLARVAGPQFARDLTPHPSAATTEIPTFAGQ